MTRLDHPTTAAAPPRTRDSRRWWILAVLGVAQLMVVLDATIVNIALPHAQAASASPTPTGSGSSPPTRSPSAACCCSAAGSPTFRPQAGLPRSASSASPPPPRSAGPPPSFGMLVAARARAGRLRRAARPRRPVAADDDVHRPGGARQGVRHLRRHRRRRASIGLLLGGLLTEYLSWRWTMYVNVLFAVAAAARRRRCLLAREHRRRPAREHRPGRHPARVCAGLFALVYGFSHAPSRDGWTDPLTLGFLVAGAVLLAAFVAVERRAAHPLLPLRIVARPQPRRRLRGDVPRRASACSASSCSSPTTSSRRSATRRSRPGLAFLPMTARSWSPPARRQHGPAAAGQPAAAGARRPGDRRRRDGDAHPHRPALELRRPTCCRRCC